MAIGSGGLYALSSAKTLIDMEGITAEEIARKAMYVIDNENGVCVSEYLFSRKIAADLCVYTNHEFVMESLDTTE